MPTGDPDIGHTALLDSARAYIFREMGKVKGYLSVVDALSITAILLGQTDARLHGGVAEIGVFFGRSFLLMAMLIEKDEKAFAADLFNIGPVEGGDSGQLTALLESAAKLDIPTDRDLLFVGTSRDLSASMLLQKTGALRFFSIDGGHGFRDVSLDAELAAATIAEFGVICFDDFCNPEWPEVSLAAFDFLRSHAETFSPILISQKKLYVCNIKYRALYTEMLAKSALLRKLHGPPVELLNWSVPYVRTSVAERIRCELFVRAGLGGLNPRFYGL